MKNLKFKYAKAENFFCFENIEINFEQYGSIVLVTAQNLDSATEDKSSSNGAGKSSLPEIPVFALYGQTIKKPKKISNVDIVNNKFNKKLTVEFRWDDYRVVRTCDAKGKNTTLRLWKSAEGIYEKETEITRGGVPSTEKYIEEIIGLNYKTFCNLYMFNADDPTTAFLECDAPTKREIVENLLSLDKYRTYNENAKTFVKTAKDKIKLLSKDYEHLLNDLESCKQRVLKVEQQESEWKKVREKEIENLKTVIQNKMKQLESSDVGAALTRYNEAQEQIKNMKDNIPTLETKKNKLNEIIEIGTPKLKQAENKFDEIKISYKNVKSNLQECMDEINKNKKTIENINNKIGEECPYCYSNVSEDNFTKIIKKSKEVIETKTTELISLQDSWDIINKEHEAQNVLVSKLEKGLLQAKQQIYVIDKEITGIYSSISELSKIKEPKAGVEERLIQEQIDELKKQIVAKKSEVEGPSPFVKILETVTQELIDKTKEVTNKKEDVSKAEKELPYYEFWVKAFSDTGIRKYIVDGIIPALNSRIAYWLQFLIDNKIKLEFDSQLKETIDRYPFMGRPYIYHGCSGGQRRRLNLSVAAAFAYIQLLKTGCSPSVIWLDEITMNMDEIGVDGIYRMICELAKEKQVFIIDHNRTLLQMLDGCDKMQLVMQEEVTKMIV